MSIIDPRFHSGRAGIPDPRFNLEGKPPRPPEPFDHKVRIRPVAFLDFFPGLYRDSAALQEFLSPAENLYNYLRGEASNLSQLLWIDQCPDKFLPHLAATIGFELPSARYTTAAERRNLIKNACWMYLNKGSVAPIRKMIEILGFSVGSVIELVQDSMVSNFSRCYDRQQRVDVTLVSDTFSDGSADGWEKQNAGSTWQVMSNRLVGFGDGTLATDNCCVNDQLHDSSVPNFVFSCDFEVLAGANPWFGIVPRWQDLWDFTRLGFLTDGGTDYLQLLLVAMGFDVVDVRIDLTGICTYKTGIHQLIYWNQRGETIIGLDDTTLMRMSAADSLGLYGALNSRSGMYVLGNDRVAFDNVQIQKINPTKLNVTFDESASKRELTIRLGRNPAHKTAKIEYLENVLPNYVPMGVDVVLTTT